MPSPIPHKIKRGTATTKHRKMLSDTAQLEPGHTPTHHATQRRESALQCNSSSIVWPHHKSIVLRWNHTILNESHQTKDSLPIRITRQINAQPSPNCSTHFSALSSDCVSRETERSIRPTAEPPAYKSGVRCLSQAGGLVRCGVRFFS